LNGDFTKILLFSLADKLQTFKLNNMDEIMFHDMHIYKHFNADQDFKWIKSGWPVSSQSDSAHGRLSVPSEEGCLIKI